MPTFPATIPGGLVQLLDAGRSANIDGWSGSFGFLGIASTPASGSKTFVEQVFENSGELESEKSQSFGDLFFERVLVFQRRASYPIILSNVVYTVEVWNAFRNEDKTLESISYTGDEGVSAEGTEAILFEPTASRVYTVTIEEDGPSTVQAAITWNFTGVFGADHTITGARLVCFSPEIDWSGGFEETIAYRTNILQAFTGKEQRIQLRTLPRYSASFSVVTLNAKDTAGLDAMISGWQARVFGVPWWMDANPLLADAPAGSITLQVNTEQLPGFVAGGFLMLWRDQHTWEAQKIQTVAPGSVTLANITTKAWSAGDLVIPIKRGRLSDAVKITRETSEISKLLAAFDCEVTL